MPFLFIAEDLQSFLHSIGNLIALQFPIHILLRIVLSFHLIIPLYLLNHPLLLSLQDLRLSQLLLIELPFILLALLLHLSGFPLRYFFKLPLPCQFLQSLFLSLLL